MTAAVIHGRIRIWKYVEGKWNANAAVAMYQELSKVLKSAYPCHRGRFTVIEDSDPTGYKSAKAIANKAELAIVTDDLPKRSPVLKVLDYCLWHEIAGRMRVQERGFRKNKVESVPQFKQRLRKTALGPPVPQALVKKVVADMKRRCRIISDRRGQLFTEQVVVLFDCS